ncbi:MAG: glycosyltransferase [Calothrix sp. SM1_5_4]|nr:glycosyltransferase [Calothrix sp. SM1_5_4]
MSSVKMTRLFAAAGYTSIEICQPDTPIHKALREQGLEARTVRARDYISPATTWTIRNWLKESGTRAVFLHSMRDIWLVTPALWGMPEIKLFGFARMFFKDVNKRDLMHTWMYSRLNKMIALSHIQKAIWPKCLPVPENKFIVIPNGVDTERFQPRPGATISESNGPSQRKISSSASSDASTARRAPRSSWKPRRKSLASSPVLASSWWAATPSEKKASTAKSATACTPSA